MSMADSCATKGSLLLSHILRKKGVMLMETKLYKRISNGVARVEKVMMVAALAFAVVLTTINVFTRYVLHTNFSWSEEVVVAAFVLMSMLGAALCAREYGGLINMTILTSSLKPRTQRTIELFTLIMLLVFALLMIVGGYLRCAAKFASGQVTSSLQIPDWIYNAFVPLGGILLFLHTGERFFDCWYERAALTSKTKEDDAQ